MARTPSPRLEAEYSYRDSVDEQHSFYSDTTLNNSKERLNESVYRAGPTWWQRHARELTVRKLLFRLSLAAALFWALTFGGQTAKKNYKIVPVDEKLSTGFHAKWQNVVEQPRKMCPSGRGIVIDAAMDQFTNIQRLVATFQENIIDHRHFRLTFIVDNDWLRGVLVHRLSLYPNLDLEILTLQDAISNSSAYTGYSDIVGLDAAKDFAQFGTDEHFRLQTVRKLYGSVASGCAQNLVISPETRFIRRGSLGDAFKRYFEKPYVITSHSTSQENHGLRRSMAAAANQVYGVGEDLMEDIWFAEYFHWFIDRRLALSMFDRVQEYHSASLYDVLRRQSGMVWEFTLLYMHAYLHRTEFPEYQFLDQRELTSSFLKSYPGAWQQYEAETRWGTGSLEIAPFRLREVSFTGVRDVFNYLGFHSFTYEEDWPTESKRLLCDFVKSTPSILMQTASKGRWPPLDQPCNLDSPMTNVYGVGIEIKRPLPLPPQPPQPAAVPVHPPALQDEWLPMEFATEEEDEWLEMEEEAEWAEVSEMSQISAISGQVNRRPNNWSRVPPSPAQDQWSEVMAMKRRRKS